MKKSLSPILDALLHFLWPTACPVCGRAGCSACSACLDGVLTTGGIVCFSCRRSWPCDRHQEVPPLFFGARYDEAMASDLVRRMKFEGHLHLARPMGAALARRFSPPSGERLVPVPLHAESERPKNQALELALGIGKIWGLPAEDLLRWKPGARRQVGLGASARRALDADALEWASPIFPTNVILVDDVCTTGSTLERAIDAVCRAGGRVSACVVWGKAEGGPFDGQT